MSLISNFAKITEESQAEYASMKDAVLSRTDVLGDSCEGDNLLAFCDNASFMKYLRDTAGMCGKVKMIYIDPPFFSKANYEATLSVVAITTITIGGNMDASMSPISYPFCATIKATSPLDIIPTPT